MEDPISIEWLVGTWQPKIYDKEDDDIVPCEVTNPLSFMRSGRFEDESSRGRFELKENGIRYFDRKTYLKYYDDEDPNFQSEAMEDWSSTAIRLGNNLFEENGDIWHRCEIFD